MKRNIFFLSVALSTAVICGFGQPAQNDAAGKHDKQTDTKEIKTTNNPAASLGRNETEYFKLGKAQEGKPGILLLLTAEKTRNGKSTSFLKSYVYGINGQGGC
jgi:hypothetical protein